MPCYVGLDVSKQLTSICAMDAKGGVLREGRVESSPKSIVDFLRGDRVRYARVGIEACGLAAWLYQGLARAGLPVLCIEARHAHGVLSARCQQKTDRSDARGIADLMRTGTFRVVHIKTRASQEARAILTARKILRAKAMDLENAIRGLLLGFGIKFEPARGLRFDRRVKPLIAKDAFAARLVLPLLDLRERLLAQAAGFEAQLRELAAQDSVCANLMTAPGVGPLTALTFRTAIDEPGRFASSRSVGAHFGLVPKLSQSGDVERRGRITKHGDRDVRAMLYLAALSAFRTGGRKSWLSAWGEQVAARRGRKRAVVAVARRLAVVLHRMWLSGSPFRWETLPA